MTCGFMNSAGTDLDSIFAVKNSNAGVLGFQCSNGQDLGNRYSNLNTLGYAVGFQNSAGTDIGYLRGNQSSLTKTITIPCIMLYDTFNPNFIGFCYFDESRYSSALPLQDPLYVEGKWSSMTIPTTSFGTHRKGLVLSGKLCTTKYDASAQGSTALDELSSITATLTEGSRETRRSPGIIGGYTDNTVILNSTLTYTIT